MEKRLPGECGTPVCLPATWKMLKKLGFGGKLSIVLVQKKKKKFNQEMAIVASILISQPFMGYHVNHEPVLLGQGHFRWLPQQLSK